MLAIVGEPGIGKTDASGEDAVRQARATRRRGPRGRPAESEARLSFAGLTDLLSPVDPRACSRRLPHPQHLALDVALLRAAGRPPAGAPARRDGAALPATRARRPDSRGRRRGRRRPLARPAVRRRRSSSRCGGWPTSPSGSIVSVRREVERTGLVGRVPDAELAALELGPLSVASLHRIVADAPRADVSPPDARPDRPGIGRATRCTRSRSPGCSTARSAVGADGASRSRGSAGARRQSGSRSLPAKTQAALLRAAALARPDLQPGRRERARAGRGGGSRPDRRRSARRVRPSALRLRRLLVCVARAAAGRTHRALAGAVADPEETGTAPRPGCRGPGRGRSRARSPAAARGARMRGAPDTAAELTELALRLMPEGDPCGPSCCGSSWPSTSIWRATSSAQPRLLEQLRAEPRARGSPRTRPADARRRSTTGARGSPLRSLLAEEALDAARDPAVRARVPGGDRDVRRDGRPAEGCRCGAGRARPAGRAARRRPRARSRRRWARGCGPTSSSARASTPRPRSARAYFEERAPPAAVDTRVVFKLGQWLRYVDDLDGARRRLAQAEQAARDEGDESSLANILLNRVVAESWAGEWEEADELAERMVDAFEQLGVEPDGVRPVEGVRRRARRAARSRARGRRAGRPQEPIVAMIWVRCLGLAELAAGEARGRRPAPRRGAGRARAGGLPRAGDLARRRRRDRGGRRGRATSTGPRSSSHASRSTPRARGIPWSLAVSARCRGAACSPQAGSSRAPPRRCERALAEHERCPCRSSGRARSSSRGRSSAA